jgi:hypothetical protein
MNAPNPVNGSSVSPTNDEKWCVTKLIGRYKGDTFVDELLFTQFADKVMIIKKSAVMSSNRTRFKNDLGRVRKLRDALAHANDYAGNRGEAREVCETVRIMDTWIEKFGRWISCFKEVPHATP